jgi:hypothetical protein
MADKYSAHNAIPEHVISAALRAYAETGEPIASICARLKISASTLNRERQERGIAIRPRMNAKGGRPRRAGRSDVYAVEPRTPTQQRVWAVLTRKPTATMDEVAAEVGCSKNYVSRLRLHWEALRP